MAASVIQEHCGVNVVRVLDAESRYGGRNSDYSSVGRSTQNHMPHFIHFSNKEKR